VDSTRACDALTIVASNPRLVNYASKQTTTKGTVTVHDPVKTSTNPIPAKPAPKALPKKQELQKPVAKRLVVERAATNVKSKPGRVSVRRAAPVARSGAKEKRQVERNKTMTKRGGGTPMPRNFKLNGLSKDVPNPNMIQDRLKKRSPWYQSLHDPLHGADCKIPDETGVETGTIQFVQRLHVEANADGVCGAGVICPWPNSGLDGGDGSSRNLFRIDADATTSSMTFDTFELSGIQDLIAVARGVRVVSASVMAISESSSLQNAGEMLAFSIPFEARPPVAPSADSYDDYLNQYKSTIQPVNANHPMISRYYPVSIDLWSFKSFFDPTRHIISNEEADHNPVWQFGVLMSGCQAGTPFSVTICINYEFIPEFNSVNLLDVSPSPQDAQEVDLVENWVQDMDVNSTIPLRTYSAAPKTVEPSHDDEVSGMGMFFEVLKEAVPLVLSII